MTMTGPAGPDRAARSPRGLKIALIASLALNLLILGTIGGSLWAFRHGGPWMGRAVNAHLLGFTTTLPSERRYAVWQATRTERRALRPFRKEVRRARAEARSALVAEPFDKEKFAAAQARVLEAEISARREAYRLFIAIAAVLTPEERAAFARWQPVQRAERLRMLRRERSDDGQPPAPPAQQR